MQSRILLALSALTIALSAPAFARTGHPPAPQMQQHCPPGLAKKNPPCQPPGQAAKPQPGKPHPPAAQMHKPQPPKAQPHQAHKAPKFKKGERIRSGAQWIRHPERYRGLDKRKNYWAHDGYVYQVEPKTGKVLALIGLLSALAL